MFQKEKRMKFRVRYVAFHKKKEKSVRYVALVRFGDFLTEEASLYAIISFVFFGYFLDLKINKLKNA